MDPTLLAGLTGILGAVIGSLLGGVFALKATKRQVEVMLEQAREDVHERLYSQSLEIMKFFAEHPEVYPYFYDNKPLAKAANEMERLRVLSTAEMVSGLHGVGGRCKLNSSRPRYQTSLESLHNRLLQFEQRRP
jgi:hypothetical protein